MQQHTKDKLFKAFVVFSIIVGLVVAALTWKLWVSYKEGLEIESRRISLPVARGSINNAAELDISPTPLAQGEFVEVDLVHKGSGGVEIYEIEDTVYIRLTPEFRVTQGPDLYLHLSAPQEYGGAMGATIENTLNLGKLHRPSGEQVYTVTKEEWEKYNHSLLVWCRAFGVHFSHAILTDN